MKSTWLKGRRVDKWSQRWPEFVIDLKARSEEQAAYTYDQSFGFDPSPFDEPVLIIKKTAETLEQRRPRKGPLLLRSLPWQCLTPILSRLQRVLIALEWVSYKDTLPSSHPLSPIKAPIGIKKDSKFTPSGYPRSLPPLQLR